MAVRQARPIRVVRVNIVFIIAVFAFIQSRENAQVLINHAVFKHIPIVFANGVGYFKINA